MTERKTLRMRFVACCVLGSIGKVIAPGNNILYGVVWRLCKKFFTALRAELCFDRHVILTISLREIVKMTCLSK